MLDFLFSLFAIKAILGVISFMICCVIAIRILMRHRPIYTTGKVIKEEDNGKTVHMLTERTEKLRDDSE